MRIYTLNIGETQVNYLVVYRYLNEGIINFAIKLCKWVMKVLLILTKKKYLVIL